MRYLVVLLLLFPSFVRAQISIEVKQQPLKEILKLIESKSEYRFFYNEGLTGLDQECTLKVNNTSIDKVMSQLLSQTSINYKKDKDNLIVLYQKTAGQPQDVPNETAKKTAKASQVSSKMKKDSHFRE